MQAQTTALAMPEPMPLHQACFLGLLTAAICLLIIFPAFAGYVNTPMGDVLCTIVYFVYGNLGRGLSTLAVIVVGAGATMGKVSWGLAVTVAVGIAVIFNADTIVGYLVGGTPC